MKLSCCLIVKNEEKNIENCLKSLKPFVDEIVVVDTGSTDRTPELCKLYADKFEVFTECNGPDGKIEDFSMARQRSLDLATNECVLWVDGDDVLVNGEKIKEIVEKYKPTDDKHMQILLPYEYSYNSKGDVTCYQWRERIVYPKSSFKWVCPVHEVLLHNDVNECVRHQSDEVKLSHRREIVGKPSDPTRNYRILKKHYEKHGNSDPRLVYYYALECGNNGFFDEALKYHQVYTSVSQWDDEKCLSCLKLAEIFLTVKKDYMNAIAWAMHASTVKPEWGEPLFFVARCYYSMAMSTKNRWYWDNAVHFCNAGLSKPVTSTTLFINPMERKLHVHEVLNISYYNTGNIEKALESAETGLQADPNNKMLRDNADWYRYFLLKNSVTKYYNNLSDDRKNDTKNLLK